MDKIRLAVLNHTELWATGIEGRKIHGGQQMLPIMEFSLRNNPKHRLTFSKEDLKQILQVLYMICLDFCAFIKAIFENHSDYSMTLTSVEQLSAAQIGFSDFREGLSS
jgi:hypothetical protein